MRRFLPDNFLLMLLGMLALGWMVPVRGVALDWAQYGVYTGVFLLFFLHGLRLPRGDVMRAARAFGVQGAMLVFSFVVMPVAGWGITIFAGFAAPGAFPAALMAGIIYVAVLPSTVQSAISYSSIAGGNVATSVVGAALSNVTGIIATPLLVALFIGGGDGTAMDGHVVVKIASMLLLPFILGQIAQHWMGGWAMRQKSLLAVFDRAVILLSVYIAFAGAVSSGAFVTLDGGVLAMLIALLLLLLAIAFGGAMGVARILRLERGDGVSLIFAGAHKSIATGAPMAAILFGPQAGLIILPAIIYHMAQLIVSAPVANHMAKGP